MAEYLTIRPEIMEFAKEMERVMAKHDFEKGNSWKDKDPRTDEFLKDKLDEEYWETTRQYADKSEFVDLANICMMIWNRRKEGF